MQPFGRTCIPISTIELRNRHGARVHILPLGATITRLEAPDRHGTCADVVLGFDKAESYLASQAYFGAVVGRYANRIRGGRFPLDGREVRLGVNEGGNCLHGGPKGFSHRVWSIDEVQTALPHRVSLILVSEDGDQGFPGRLEVRVTYGWTDDFCLDIAYEATTTAPTPLNLTQHSYFNLSGVAAPVQTILGHILTIHADQYLPVDDERIPLGLLRPVKGGPFDFNQPKTVGRDIEASDAQLTLAGGYDHNWVLAGEGFRRVAELSHPATGRCMTIFTDQPGLQLYSGNHLGNEATGKGGAQYPRYSGIALETQHWPDAPNQPNFPSTILRPGDVFANRTCYAFSA